MEMKMTKLASLTVLLLSTSLFADASRESDEFTVGSITVIETTNPRSLRTLSHYKTDAETPPVSTTPTTTPVTAAERLERTGKVISLGKDVVALGESIYDLVKKGKPTNTTTYAAISVVPKDPTTKEPVSPFDLEGFSMPMERKFSTIVKNMSGKQVVQFDYQLLYSFGGSFEGKGKYLTGVIIVPKKVQTSWGWDFNATMRLDSIMNHGSKAAPVAGAMVTIKYQVNGWSKAIERNDSIHLTGAGEVKNFGVQ